MEYTVKTAMAYGKRDQIEKWVHGFLNGIGNNPGFSEGLKLQKRYWLGPIILPLNLLSRCCGPEEDIQFHEPKENWERRIDAIVKAMDAGIEMPPLIVKYENGVYELNDGNHRHEAFLRYGLESCWVILWDSGNQLDESHGHLWILQNILNAKHWSKIEGGRVKESYIFEKDGQLQTMQMKHRGINTVSHVLIDMLQERKLPIKKSSARKWHQLNFELAPYLIGDHPKEIPEALRATLNQIHDTDISQTKGYGWIRQDGNGQFDSMRAFVESFFSNEQSGFWYQWFELFSRGMERDIFHQIYDTVLNLMKYSEPFRTLIHGDLHLKNVLVDADQISGIIDWDNAMYFDKLYDVATLSYAKGYDTLVNSFKMEPHFEKRLLCMRLIRGLDGMRFYVKKGDMATYAAIKRELLTLLDR